MKKTDYVCTNRFHLGWGSFLRTFFGISGFIIFAPIVVILALQENYGAAGIFPGIYLFVMLALCFERDMIVEIYEDGLVIIETATIYHKEKKYSIPYSNIVGIYNKKTIGFNYCYDAYVISSKGNDDIELLPINKENIQLKLYLDSLNARFSNNSNYVKSNENKQKKENVLSKWKIACLVLFILIGTLFCIIKSLL